MWCFKELVVFMKKDIAASTTAMGRKALLCKGCYRNSI